MSALTETKTNQTQAYSSIVILIITFIMFIISENQVYLMFSGLLLYYYELFRKSIFTFVPLVVIMAILYGINSDIKVDDEFMMMWMGLGLSSFAIAASTVRKHGFSISTCKDFLITLFGYFSLFISGVTSIIKVDQALYICILTLILSSVCFLIVYRNKPL